MDKELYREKLKIDWVLMNMRLDGSTLDPERAEKIASGEYVLDATLEEHVMVNRLISVLPLMEALFGMKEELSRGTLNRFYQKLAGGEEAVYRKTTPILFHLSYNPVLPQEIDGELGKLFASLHDGSIKDPLERAVYVHNGIIRIYPFDEYSEIIARAAMEYELLYSGQPLCMLTLSETEYNSALAEYMKKGKDSVILENLRLNSLMAENRLK